MVVRDYLFLSRRRRSIGSSRLWAIKNKRKLIRKTFSGACSITSYDNARNRHEGTKESPIAGLSVARVQQTEDPKRYSCVVAFNTKLDGPV